MNAQSGVKRHASLSKRTAKKTPVTLKELHKERLRTKVARDLSGRVRHRITPAVPKDELLELTQEASSVLKHIQEGSSRSNSQQNSRARLLRRRPSASKPRYDFSSKLIDILNSVQAKQFPD